MYSDAIDFIGDVRVPESLVQKIWLEQNFLNNQLATESGRSVKILRRGDHNPHEGPDFKNAEVLIDGELLHGDVEIHLRPSDWLAHGHQEDPNFTNVILHVCLFSEGRGQSNSAYTALGFAPELLLLLPYLHQAIEEYAFEDSVNAFSPHINMLALERFVDIPVGDRLALLRDYARKRWLQKLGFAKRRLELFDWDDACHQQVLEVLGYRRNRAPMASIARQFPFTKIQKTSAEELYLSQEGYWKEAGVRPPNAPKRRLQQYAQLIENHPDWPSRWLPILENGFATFEESPTVRFRRKYALASLRDQLSSDVFLNIIGGTRFHTLMVDALLPLAAARMDLDLFEPWYHWYAGDAPQKVEAFLKAADVIGPGAHTLCNGLIQGSLLHFSQAALQSAQ